MTNRNGAICVQEQLRHRFADDVGAPHDHRFFTGKIAQSVLQHHETAERRTRYHSVAAGRQTTRVDHMEPVGILGRIDRIDHRLLVDLIREGQLHQNAVNRVVAVEPLDQRQKLFLRGRVGQHMLEALHPGLERRLVLIADIDLARRIGADQHDRQTWRQIMLDFQLRYCFSDPRAQIRRKRFAVDNVFIRHGVQPASICADQAGQYSCSKF